jgi:hypothetical protein
VFKPQYHQKKKKEGRKERDFRTRIKTQENIPELSSLWAESTVLMLHSEPSAAEGLQTNITQMYHAYLRLGNSVLRG